MTSSVTTCADKFRQAMKLISTRLLRRVQNSRQRCGANQKSAVYTTESDGIPSATSPRDYLHTQTTLHTMANQAAALARLDAGALNDIFEDTPGRVEQCVVQCVQIKPIVSQQSGATERHRVVFSDSRNYVQTMLATALNHYVHQGLLQRGVFLKLLSYQANNVKSKKVLIVTDIEIIQELGIMEKLGNPVALEVKTEDEDKSHPTTITSNAGAFYGNQQQRAMPATKAPTSSAHANIYPIEVRTTNDMYLVNLLTLS